MVSPSHVSILIAVVFGTLLSASAFAIQPSLVEVKPESDGTFTYVYKINIENAIQVEGGKKAPNPDFFTIYNFPGILKDSVKQPNGWTSSVQDDGITPFRGGRAVVSPLDVSGVMNITWSRTGATVEGPADVEGFSVRTSVKETMTGEYSAQVTRKNSKKEARTGSVTTPKLTK